MWPIPLVNYSKTKEAAPNFFDLLEKVDIDSFCGVMNGLDVLGEFPKNGQGRMNFIGK